MARKSKENEKILRRRRKIGLRKFWQVLKAIFALLFLAGAIYGLNYFYNSDYFKVKEIIFEGNSHYSYESFNDISKKYLGKNIFEVKKKSLEDSLIINFYWLKSVDLKKVFPDKLIIRVYERKPFIIINYSKSFYLLDEEGVIIEKLDGEDMDNYNKIIVKNVLNYNPDLGDKIAKKNLLSCGYIYKSMDFETKQLFKEAILEGSLGEIAFITSESKKVIFGNSEDIVQKITVLKEILKDGINYIIIDISNYNNPVIVN